MQHLPNKSYGQDSFKAIEIIVVWSYVSDDFLKLETFERPIPIANELIPPNEPISELQLRMSTMLERAVAEEEASTQKRSVED